MYVFSRRHKRVLGIYMSGEGVSICEAGAYRGKPTIERIEYLNEEVALEEIPSQIGEWARECSFQTNRANIVIPSRHLSKTYLELPYMSPDHTDNYGRYELKRLYGMDPSKYHLQSYVLSITPYRDFYMQRVLVFGVSKDIIDLYINQFNDSGLRVKTFILPIDAQIAILDNIAHGLIEGDQILCWLYIELNSIDLCFYSEGSLIYMSTLSIVGEEIDSLEMEIKRTLNHFYMINHGRKIGRVILSGEYRDGELFLTLFDRLGFRAQWLDSDMLAIRYRANYRDMPLPMHINAIGSAMYM